jgi:hypothetical protein
MVPGRVYQRFHWCILLTEPIANRLERLLEEGVKVALFELLELQGAVVETYGHGCTEG